MTEDTNVTAIAEVQDENVTGNVTPEAEAGTVAEAIEAEVVDVDNAGPEAEPFWLIEIFTGDENPMQFRTTDPQAGQKTVEECVAKGTFTATIQNGIQVFPVRTARITGPYVEQPAEEVAE